MKGYLPQPVHARRWVIFFFTLSSLLFAGYSGLLTTGKTAQEGWHFEIEQGKKSRSSISIHNFCREPHLFGITNKVKYLTIAQPTEAVLVGTHSTQFINFEFDATGLDLGVYRDAVVVECLDCQKEPECEQPRNELLIAMTVVKASVPSLSTSPGIDTTGDNGPVLSRVDVRAGLVCAAPPPNMVSWLPMDSLPLV